MGIDKDLLNILCCPNCQGNLKEVKNHLICNDCKKKFLVKDNIPILLKDYI